MGGVFVFLRVCLEACLKACLAAVDALIFGQVQWCV
jgi:hypothetical protein